MGVLKDAHKYAKKYYIYVILHILCGFVAIGFLNLIPQATQIIIDYAINPALGEALPTDQSSILYPLIKHAIQNSEYWKVFFTMAAALGVMLLVRYLLHWIRWYMAHSFGIVFERDLRHASYSKIINQNSIVLNRYTSGDLLSIANTDPIMVKDIYALHIPIIIDQFFAVPMAVYFLTKINPYLLITPSVLAIGLIISTALYIVKIRRVFGKIRNASVELNSCIHENINGVKIVRATAAEAYEMQKFDQKNNNYKQARFEHADVWSKFTAIFSALAQSITLISMIIGVVFAIRGTITIGQFSTFGAYVFLISNPMIILTNYLGNFQQSLVCGTRLFTFLKTSNIITDIQQPQRILDKPHLKLNNVGLRLDDTVALDNINLDIPYGKKLGIMGKTGQGKSVLLKSCARFFEVTEGEVLINDINIKNIALDDVRRQFSYVLQDVFLFSNTVDSNIAFYDPDAPKEQVENCAILSDAHSFIQKLENGYQTIVGERGHGLSGGQKQRLSIARALLKDAPIIMLDDCTSALDLETERKVLKNIKQDYFDRTLIIASHRAAAVCDCDEILFFENGKISERGTHQELLRLNGKYATVFYSQQASQREVLADG